VCAGTPLEVMKHAQSHTGKALKEAEKWGHSSFQAQRSQVQETKEMRNVPISAISIHGAREHNLQNIDVEIPRNRFTVVTGVSGSGKSTLAFDIVFGEGQRRYLESLNALAAQFRASR